MIDIEQFIATVKKHLEDKTPFAFTRYSDGEIMLLNRHEYYDQYINIIYKLWGYVPDEDELIAVDAYLQYSLKNSDVIGYPGEKHRNRTDYFRDTDRVFQREIGDPGDYALTSSDMAHYMLSGERYFELLYKCHTLNYVSCWNLDQQFQDRFSISHINHFIVQPEPKFTSGYVGDRHFPTQFYQIRNWIKSKNCKGELCLVGAGVFSKIYNIWFKQQGGVSLDIGSVFDSFAGRKTRGEGKGLDVEDLTYKL